MSSDRQEGPLKGLKDFFGLGTKTPPAPIEEKKDEINPLAPVIDALRDHNAAVEKLPIGRNKKTAMHDAGVRAIRVAENASKADLGLIDLEATVAELQKKYASDRAYTPKLFNELGLPEKLVASIEDKTGVYFEIQPENSDKFSTFAGKIFNNDGKTRQQQLTPLTLDRFWLRNGDKLMMFIEVQDNKGTAWYGQVDKAYMPAILEASGVLKKD